MIKVTCRKHFVRSNQLIFIYYYFLITEEISIKYFIYNEQKDVLILIDAI